MMEEENYRRPLKLFLYKLCHTENVDTIFKEFHMSYRFYITLVRSAAIYTAGLFISMWHQPIQKGYVENLPS